MPVHLAVSKWFRPEFPVQKLRRMATVQVWRQALNLSPEANTYATSALLMMDTKQPEPSAEDAAA